MKKSSAVSQLTIVHGKKPCHRSKWIDRSIVRSPQSEHKSSNHFPHFFVLIPPNVCALWTHLNLELDVFICLLWLMLLLRSIGRCRMTADDDDALGTGHWALVTWHLALGAQFAWARLNGLKADQQVIRCEIGDRSRSGHSRMWLMYTSRKYGDNVVSLICPSMRTSASYVELYILALETLASSRSAPNMRAAVFAMSLRTNDTLRIRIPMRSVIVRDIPRISHEDRSTY